MKVFRLGNCETFVGKLEELLVTCPCSPVVKALGRHVQYSVCVTRSVAGIQTSVRARLPAKKNSRR